MFVCNAGFQIREHANMADDLVEAVLYCGVWFEFSVSGQHPSFVHHY